MWGKYVKCMYVYELEKDVCKYVNDLLIMNIQYEDNWKITEMFMNLSQFGADIRPVNRTGLCSYY